jgi:hypothetical protein
MNQERFEEIKRKSREREGGKKSKLSLSMEEKISQME